MHRFAKGPRCVRRRLEHLAIHTAASQVDTLRALRHGGARSRVQQIMKVPLDSEVTAGTVPTSCFRPTLLVSDAYPCRFFRHECPLSASRSTIIPGTRTIATSARHPPPTVSQPAQHHRNSPFRLPSGARVAKGSLTASTNLMPVPEISFPISYVEGLLF